NRDANPGVAEQRQCDAEELGCFRRGRKGEQTLEFDIRMFYGFLCEFESLLRCLDSLSIGAGFEFNEKTDRTGCVLRGRSDRFQRIPVIDSNRHSCKVRQVRQAFCFRLPDHVVRQQDVRNPRFGHCFRFPELLDRDSDGTGPYLFMSKEWEFVRLDVRSKLDLVRVAIGLQPPDIVPSNFDVDDRDRGFQVGDLHTVPRVVRPLRLFFFWPGDGTEYPGLGHEMDVWHPSLIEWLPRLFWN